jgi:hypothetical protein
MVPLHFETLDNAINQLNIPNEVHAKLSLDQKYLCHVMDTAASVLPLHGRA